MYDGKLTLWTTASNVGSGGEAQSYLDSQYINRSTFWINYCYASYEDGTEEKEPFYGRTLQFDRELAAGKEYQLGRFIYQYTNENVTGSLPVFGKLSIAPPSGVGYGG